MESTTTPAGAATVTRTVKGAKATLTITWPDGHTSTLGGKRAGRAEAVIVTKVFHSDEVGYWGVRGDLAKAQAEAHRLVVGGERLVRSPVRGLPARRVATAPVAEWAVAVPVTGDPKVVAP